MPTNSFPAKKLVGTVNGRSVSTGTLEEVAKFLGTEHPDYLKDYIMPLMPCGITNTDKARLAYESTKASDEKYGIIVQWALLATDKVELAELLTIDQHSDGILHAIVNAKLDKIFSEEVKTAGSDKNELERIIYELNDLRLHERAFHEANFTLDSIYLAKLARTNNQDKIEKKLVNAPQGYEAEKMAKHLLEIGKASQKQLKPKNNEYWINYKKLNKYFMQKIKAANSISKINAVIKKMPDIGIAILALAQAKRDYLVMKKFGNIKHLFKAYQFYERVPRTWNSKRHLVAGLAEMTSNPQDLDKLLNEAIQNKDQKTVQQIKFKLEDVYLEIIASTISKQTLRNIKSDNINLPIVRRTAIERLIEIW